MSDADSTVAVGTTATACVSAPIRLWLGRRVTARQQRRPPPTAQRRAGYIEWCSNGPSRANSASPPTMRLPPRPDVASHSGLLLAAVCAADAPLPPAPAISVLGATRKPSP